MIRAASIFSTILPLILPLAKPSNRWYLKIEHMPRPYISCFVQSSRKQTASFLTYVWTAKDSIYPAAMPTPQQGEIHHSKGARFQSGNRVYKVVVLGQGGVGKSGMLQLASLAWGAWISLLCGLGCWFPVYMLVCWCGVNIHCCVRSDLTKVLPENIQCSTLAASHSLHRNSIKVVQGGNCMVML